MNNTKAQVRARIYQPVAMLVYGIASMLAKNAGALMAISGIKGAVLNRPELAHVSAIESKSDYMNTFGLFGTFYNIQYSKGIYANVEVIEVIPLENVLNILKTETPNIEESIGGLSAGYYVFPSVVGAHGRANFILPEELHVNEKSNRKCWEFNIGVLHPEGPAAVLIDPSGFVDGCFGVPLGNLYKASMIDIFKSYFDDPNPIIRLLHEKGALGLKQLAVERGFRPNNAYYDECHLCHMARNYLKKYCSEEFGEYLAPNTCYPSITWQGYGKGK